MAFGLMLIISLIVAFTESELQSLPDIVQENHACGDMDVRQLSRSELQALEPQLNKAAIGAVLIPGETLVDPWMLPLAYAAEVCYIFFS